MQAENFSLLEKALASLSSGAFLTTSADGKANTMTISWGHIGIMWFKPVFTVVVRQSRYTKELLEQTGEFTVSFPFQDLKAALDFCGTKSGRNIDKISAAKLITAPGRTVSVPIIANCNLHCECKVVYKQTMSAENLAETIKAAAYSAGDYHTMYYGEITSCYLTE